jgi:hypothetical protein
MTESTKVRRESVAWPQLAEVAFAVFAAGLGIPEIAKRLNMNPDTVAMRLSSKRSAAREAGMTDEDIAAKVVPSFTAVRGKQEKHDKAYFERLHAERLAKQTDTVEPPVT